MAQSGVVLSWVVAGPSIANRPQGRLPAPGITAYAQRQATGVKRSLRPARIPEQMDMQPIAEAEAMLHT